MARLPTLFSPGALWGSNDPFVTLHREMNRLFDEVMRGGALTGGGSAAPGGGMMMMPNVDVSETDKEVRIRAELPGVSEKDIELSLHDDLLTLRAEKKQERSEEREGMHVNERSFGTFQRSLRLPFQVDAEHVQARFENGVLSVTVPKGRQTQAQRIQIQGAQPQALGQQAGASPPGAMQDRTVTVGEAPATASTAGAGSTAAQSA